MTSALLSVVALLATFGCGYLGASAWAILAGAVVLASLRSEAHFEFADRYEVLGRVRAWALVAGASIAGRALPCALAFVAGRTVTLVA